MFVFTLVPCEVDVPVDTGEGIQFNSSYHGKAHIGLLERGSIVRSIPSDSDYLALVPNSAVNDALKVKNVS